MVQPTGVDPFQVWAAERGWRVARNVPKRVLKGLPGQPFHEYRRKKIPLLLAGTYQGMPAMVMQIDYRTTRSPGGASTIGDSGQLSNSVTLDRPRGVAVLEVPWSFPELLVDGEIPYSLEFNDVLSFNKSLRSVQPRAIEKVRLDNPENLDGGGFTYRASGDSADYVRSIVHPDRLRWLNENFEYYSNQKNKMFPAFRFSGNKVMFWVNNAVFYPEMADRLLSWAQYVMRWAVDSTYAQGAKTATEKDSLINLPISFLA